jgi:hypothetical protein
MTFARNKRPLFGAAALLCYAAAIVLTPTGVRSQLDSRVGPAQITDIPIDQAPRAIAPERDAFAPQASVDDDQQPVFPSPPPQLSRLLLPHVAPAPAPITVTSRVTAVVTGTNPTAIVDSGGESRLVSLGDALDGSTIVAITNDAVVLGNGKRLTLQPAATP